ncbi:Zn-ribbon domain-containing OB-fold protein [Actinomadura sp. 1N219]|uniref:Zn-ribbon domain-containing OB-fold protein n=1 Tax=Actinomadura sp. 1N219 TaxID=3375152 RepID=UPI0037A1E4BD
MAVYKGFDIAADPAGSDHRGYFEAAGRGELVVQRCTNADCGLMRGQIGAACPFCTGLEWEWRPVAGTGVIYSYQIVARAVNPAFADWVPYPVVLVELDEQRGVPWRGGAEDESVSLRKIANLVDGGDPSRPEDEANVAIGLRVRVCFTDLGDGLALPQFRLSGEPPEHAPWRAPTRTAERAASRAAERGS